MHVLSSRLAQKMHSHPSNAGLTTPFFLLGSVQHSCSQPNIPVRSRIPRRLEQSRSPPRIDLTRRVGIILHLTKQVLIKLSYPTAFGSMRSRVTRTGGVGLPSKGRRFWSPHSKSCCFSCACFSHENHDLLTFAAARGFPGSTFAHTVIDCTSLGIQTIDFDVGSSVVPPIVSSMPSTASIPLSPPVLEAHVTAPLQIQIPGCDTPAAVAHPLP
ncbi:hypothetical protein K437DRAFT_96185 [Tilletiaria anomala UBC 951]|uniref:Uncharacterized protein n=1 Tax=Tilletiaria anomala (strain ATCC 24038 / CBS 436.72 / UBC 951) TaxID=1037660 RepID=A0A066WQE9_TILAU|nr:uncharacterized protein K437DRAFT_96185 [Tilletiaria anomala UBC 951]KDN53239.1 hypothetical protein K437DRAFT_96185 [Tilletiaria anomala UBC 951]